MLSTVNGRRGCSSKPTAAATSSGSAGFPRSDALSGGRRLKRADGPLRRHALVVEDHGDRQPRELAAWGSCGASSGGRLRSSWSRNLRWSPVCGVAARRIAGVVVGGASAGRRLRAPAAADGWRRRGVSCGRREAGGRFARAPATRPATAARASDSSWSACCGRPATGPNSPRSCRLRCRP